MTPRVMLPPSSTGNDELSFHSTESCEELHSSQANVWFSHSPPLSFCSQVTGVRRLLEVTTGDWCHGDCVCVCVLFASRA